MQKRPFVTQLLSLISESGFVRLENILGEPNFFKIVGQTHFERWHSCFWGWLLDPTGSHLISAYIFQRFLLLLLDERCLKPHSEPSKFLFNILPTVEFEAVEVSPNENTSTERSVSGVGRFDVFLSALYRDSFGNSGRINVIFEFKVVAKPDKEQSKKYAVWLNENHPDDVNFLIYILPTLGATPYETVGDDNWYCLDYQTLNDKLLAPVLDHPKLNEKVRPFIVQYVKNLKSRYKGIKMAITQEEKDIAVALYEKYSDVFDSVFDVLVTEGLIKTKAKQISLDKGRATGRLAVKLNGKVFDNQTVRLLYEDILSYLVNNNLLQKLPLPWGPTKQRYLLTIEKPPTHPNGKGFFYPVICKEYVMESHYSRENGVKMLRYLCEKLDVTFETIET